MRAADEASGKPAHEFLRACDEAHVRSAVAGAEPELLSLADGDVGAVLAGRSEDGEADGVDARDGERADTVRALGEAPGIDEQTKEVWLLEDDRGRLASGLVAALHLHAAAFAERVQHFDVLGVQVARDEDLVAACVDAGHHRSLRDRGRAVVQRCIRHVHRGQLGDERLELVDRLQRALACLGLVGRVRGVELRLAGHGGNGRGDEPLVDAAAPEGQAIGEDAVRRSEVADRCHRLELGKSARQFQVVDSQRRWNVAEERVHRFDSDCRQHLLPILRRMDQVGHLVSAGLRRFLVVGFVHEV